MEEELNWHLEHPPDDSTPWDGDEFINWLIATGQVPSLHDEEAETAIPTPSTFQNAA